MNRKHTSQIEQIHEGLPRVSVIVPARNEERFLARALSALGTLNYPPAWIEIIVVNNCSTDSTATIARAYGAKVVDYSGGRVGALRNAGSRVAHGDILAFLDADCVPAATWLKDAIRALREPDVGAVGGPCMAPGDGNWVERTQGGARPTSQRVVDALAASSLIMPRDVFIRVGGFDDQLVAGEDDDISRKIREAGRHLLSLPGCSVIHLGYPSTLLGVLRRQIWHGRSQLQVAGGRLDPLLLLSHVFAIDLLLLLGGTAGGLRWTFVAILLLGSVCLAAAAALKRNGGWGRRAFPLTALYWFFLLGRAIGLFLSYGNLVGRRLRRNASVISDDPR